MSRERNYRRFRVRRHALDSGLVYPWVVADLTRPAYFRHAPTHADALAAVECQLELEAKALVEARERDDDALSWIEAQERYADELEARAADEVELWAGSEATS